MKAAYYQNFGSASEVLKIGDLSVAVPQDDEVLVRLYASGINPSDVKIRAGQRGKGIDFPYIIPHHDGAGIIESVGKNIANSRVGERVWVHNACWHRHHGTAAEYIALPAELCLPLPDNTSFVEGACLGVPAITAYASLFAFEPIKGKTILVTGGAGSVGNVAIQMAKYSGATVITTVSSAAKGKHAKFAGADLVINYRQEDVIKIIKEYTNNNGVDHIVEVEFGDNLKISKEILAPHGTIAAYGSSTMPIPELPFYPLMFKNIRMKFVFVYELPHC